jgi:hypothetical protein
LISHAETYLGVHHSPDLFHVQQEACRATGGSLHHQKEKAEKAFQQAEVKHRENQRIFNEFEGNWPWTLQQLELDKQQRSLTPSLTENLTHARQELETAQARQLRARDARRGIGQAYHPFDLTTGAPQEAADVQIKLEAHFDTLDQIASEAGLSASSLARLAKARRVLPLMIETMVFFWTLMTSRASALKYVPEIVEVWRRQLVAGYYLADVAQRCSNSKERQRLRELSRSILEQAKARDGPLSELSEADVAYLDEQARLAAKLFQRSSSCVEGRNGQLSLRHHGLREISARKLRVLGILHNFVIQDRDGKTAANGFFWPRTPRAIFMAR